MESVRELLGGTAIEQDVLDRSFYEACYAPLLEAIEPLVEAGANSNTLFSIASSEGIPRRSPLATLIEYGRDDEDAQRAAVASCLNHGADPNLRDEGARGVTPLMVAANYHLVDIANMLLEAGAEPTLLSGKEGRAEDALYKIFTRENDVNCMDALAAMLLRAGAKPDNVCGSWQRSPLMLASDAGATGACRRLIQAGAELDRKDSSGETAYVLASKRGRGEVCKVLLECGASASVNERLRASLIEGYRDQDWGKLRGLGSEAMRAFSTESWVFQSISLAHQNGGDFDGAVDCARRGLETAFADVLVSRLVLSLHLGGRSAEALDVWAECKGQLEKGNIDRHLLANVSAIYNELGRRREGLDELASFIDAALTGGSGGDGGLLEFNLACLYTLEGEVVRALQHAGSAVADGKDLDSFDTDADLADLRAHPGYRLVVHREEAGAAWSLGAEWPVREVLIDACEVVERCYQESPSGSEPEVDTTEYESRTAAALAYVARTQELRSEGWQPCDAPAIAYWSEALVATLEGWRVAQDAGTLEVLGAMVVEWDFGDSDGVRNLWIAGYGAAPKGTYESYVSGDDMLVDESNSGPCIDRPQVFERIAAEVQLSPVFRAIRKESPFSFVLQEHDCGHESTVVWRE